MKKIFLLFCISSTWISALAQHTLDSSFGNNGIVHTFFPPTENISYSLGRQVITHPDGSYFILTPYGILNHRLANGAIDLNYGENGNSVPVVSESRAASLPNGKIVLGGTTYINNGYIFLFARLNTNGTLDKTFAQQGKQVIDFTGRDRLTDIATSTEGKIVAVGYSNNSSGCIITRLNPDGSLDNSFSTDGKQTSPTITSPSCVAVTSTGRIIVGGTTQGKTAVAAWLPNGEPDYSFGVNGVSTPGGIQDAKRVKIQADGKIVLAAQSTLFRLNTDGTLDNSFSDDGIQIIDSSLMDGLEDMAIDSEGRIYVAGSKITNGRYISKIPRFTSAGVLDYSFADAGLRTIDLQVYATYPYSIAIQNDGRILVAGVYVTGGVGLEYFAARLNADGSLDNSMDDDGIIIDYINVGSTQFYASVVQADGKIVCAGGTRTQGYSSDFLVARFNTNGWLDTTFSHDGFATVRFEPAANTNFFSSIAYGVALQPNGKIVVAGYNYGSGGNVDYALARLNADGGMDNSFSEDGKLTTDLLGGDDLAYSVAIQPDGKIVAAGFSYRPEKPLNSDFSLVRYNVDGTLDNSFSWDGKQSTEFFSTDDRASKVLIQPDGKILVVGEAGYRSGSSNQDFGLARFRADGSPDDQFGYGGATRIDFQGGSDAAFDAALLPDGTFLVSGTSDGHFAVAKLRSNGFLDSSFAVNGEKLVTLGYFRENCNAIAIQSNGSILLGGAVTNNSNSPKSDIAMVRLFPDGSIDGSLSFEEPSYADLAPYGKSIESINIYKDHVYAVGGATYIDRVGFIFAVRLDCSLKLSIPNAFAIPVGVEPNTVYKGYAPAEDITLTAIAKGKFPFTYLWSTGATTKYIRVRPNTTTTYDVTVTDASGCSQKVSKTLNVVDVRCGNKNEKVLLCAPESGKWPKRKTVCVDPWMATLLLWKGSRLGSCPSDGLSAANPSSIEEDTNTFGLTASPNPSRDQFGLDIKLDKAAKAELVIRDIQGRIVERRFIESSSIIKIGDKYPPGIYVAELRDGDRKVVIKLVKTGQ